MASLGADLRYACRTLRRSPGFSATAIAALALGIGATSAIFSVVDKVLLEPLPYPDPDRLVQLMTTSPLGDELVVSIPKYVSWRDHTTVFDRMAAYEIGGTGVSLTEGDFPEALQSARVSADYFALFGGQIAIGRSFSAKEDSPGGPRVAVISSRLWRGRFRGDAKLVGRTIMLSYEPYKMIGVLAPGFASPTADVWLPLQADRANATHLSRVHVAARLKGGLTLRDAQENVGDTIQAFMCRYPYPRAPMLYRETFTAIPLRDAVVGDVRPALFLLLGAVGFVLLISCANVASLQLARAARRVREIAIRAALGAERSQLIRQLLTESVVLSLAGGVLGLGLGYFGVRGLLAVSPSDIPRIGANGSAIALNWRVFLFVFVVSVGTGILFGLIPALNLSRTDVSTVVKDSVSQSGMGFRRNRGRPALVIVELALAMVLLAGAGLLIRTFVAMRTADRGFEEQNVLTLEMPLNGSPFEKTSQVAQLVRSGERRLQMLPGISEVAATCALPLEPSLTMPFTINGRDQSQVGRYHGAGTWRSVSPGFFDAFRIRLLRGRLFTDADDENSAGVVIINYAMLHKFWQDVDANPIGDFITIGKGMGSGIEELPRQIIGVVADVRDAGLKMEPMMFVPVAQVPDGMNVPENRLLPLTWVVSAKDPAALATGAIQQELHDLSGGLPLGRVRGMHEVVAVSSARTQFYMMLLTVFAAMALVLSAVGLYGLMAYSVEQRTQEIGIRMALGAEPADVRNLVVLQGMRLALLGISIGIPTALALTRVMVSMIFGIRTWDPTVFGSVALVLSGVALFATYVPSLRATRVDPQNALRF
ncbi:MAG TPA: ABC transporter permease [Bryobacteraceae bacterium]|nr:ABC transporter permease [Bryobacteraceae bacterium]